ncbi:MAG: hypothetical protein ACM3S5_14655 [Rhodospirillales bacterium]
MRLIKLALIALSGAAAIVALRGAREARSRVRWPRRQRQRPDAGAWTFDHRFAALQPGRNLRIELATPAIVHWTVDQWDTAHDTRTTPENGTHVAELPTASLKNGTRIQFTFFWPEVNRWEGEDFQVTVEEEAVRYAT